MNSYIKQSIAAALLVALIGGTALSQSKVGTSAAPFLGIAVGPKGVALGGAYVALANDVTALYYNPGAVSQQQGSQFMVSHTDWLVDTKFDWVGVSINLDGSSVVGISITQLNYGEEIITTEDFQDGTGETWTAADIAIGLSYARNLTDRFSIGGTAKYIQQKIWNESASSFALDVGLKYVTDFNGMTIGMSISNFGADMKMQGKDLFRNYDPEPTVSGNNGAIPVEYKTDEWPLPLLFRAGIAMDVLQMDDINFIVAVDALRPSDNAETVNIGGELSWKQMFF